LTVVLDEQTDSIDNHRCLQRFGKEVFEETSEFRSFTVVGHRPGQGQVKSEFIEHIGVSPAEEKLLLADGQIGPTPTGQFRLTGRSSAPIELLDQISG
jgi:hypothetical protein